MCYAVQVLVQGHKEGELWGLAVHPSTNLFVTASDDKTVRTWSVDTKVCLSVCLSVCLCACICVCICLFVHVHISV